MYQNEFQKIVNHRRSNRSFDANYDVPGEVIERCLRNAILSPNSSNLQLWEFQWIESPELLQKLIPLCLGQSAAKTAKHMVVFITRKDKWRERAKWNYEQIKKGIQGKPQKIQKRGLDYYKRLIPIVYMDDGLGIFSVLRKSVSFVLGIRKPFYRLGGKA